MDDEGRPSMVDVSSKDSTRRSATATGRIYLPHVAFDLVSPTMTRLPPQTTQDIERAKAKARAKGDVLVVAQLAAIMACKRTADLIPLCHPLPLSHISVTLTPEELLEAVANQSQGYRYAVLCQATVTCQGRTGVEMEALTAVSVGLLTVWDMLKAVAGRELIIGDIVVSRKSGGLSGDFVREQ